MGNCPSFLGVTRHGPKVTFVVGDADLHVDPLGLVRVSVCTRCGLEFISQAPEHDENDLPDLPFSIAELESMRRQYLAMKSHREEQLLEIRQQIVRDLKSKKT